MKNELCKWIRTAFTIAAMGCATYAYRERLYVDCHNTTECTDFEWARVANEAYRVCHLYGFENRGYTHGDTGITAETSVWEKPEGQWGQMQSVATGRDQRLLVWIVHDERMIEIGEGVHPEYNQYLQNFRRDLIQALQNLQGTNAVRSERLRLGESWLGP